MQKKYLTAFFMMFFGFMLMAQIDNEAKICGNKNSYALAVNWQDKLYFAVPSHVLFTDTPPKINYNDKEYRISRYYLSSLRDFALLEAESLTLKEIPTAFKLEKSELPAVQENFYFRFELNDSALKNYNDLKGKSGKVIVINDRIGLFQGYLFNTMSSKIIYLAVVLKIFPNELQEVDFEIIRTEFLAKQSL